MTESKLNSTVTKYKDNVIRDINSEIRYLSNYIKLNGTGETDTSYIGFKDKRLVRLLPAIDKYDCKQSMINTTVLIKSNWMMKSVL